MSASPTSKPKTVADLHAAEQATGLLFELADGDLREVAVSLKVSRTSARLTRYISEFVDDGGSGAVFDAEFLFDLPKSTRRADVSFIAAARLPSADEDPAGFEGAPDLVVEVLSPTDIQVEVIAKVQEWLEAGARLVWLAMPRSRRVTIYRRGRNPMTISEGDVLEGEVCSRDFCWRLHDSSRRVANRDRG